MERDNRFTNDQFVSVQDACNLLNCGRTKIYTHYISNGLLAVKKKIGNRSYFLKSDIDNLARSEQLPVMAISNPTLSTLKESELIGPSLRQEDQKNLTEYISSLQTRIHDLEQALNESSEHLKQFQLQSMQSIPLLEYQEKLRSKELEIQERNELLEFAEQRAKHLESETKQLRDLEEQTKQELLDTETRFNQSLKVALTFKNQLRQEEEKRQKLEEQFIRLRELQEQLDGCHFYEWGLKRKLRAQIQSTMSNIRRLQTSFRALT